MLGRVQTFAGGIDPTLLGKGDLANFMELRNADATAAVVALTGFHLGVSVLSRTLGAARADTMPTAAALIKAIQGQQNQSGSPLGISGGVQYPLIYQNPQFADVNLEPGATYRWRIRCVDAFADTLTATAGSGLVFNVDGTLGLTNVAAASSWTDYLVTFLATFDPVNFTGDLLNASATISNVSASDMANLQIGMTISNANITANTTRIIAINPGLSTVIMSAVATGTLVGSAISATPTVEFQRIGSGTL